MTCIFLSLTEHFGKKNSRKKVNLTPIQVLAENAGLIAVEEFYELLLLSIFLM